MGKSLRSKIKRRFRKLKRGHLDELIVKPQTQQLHSRCEKSLLGFQYRQKQYKNAFLYPDDSQSKFPQYKPQPMIDLRSASIPNSGLQWSGACRKKQKQPRHLDEVSNCQMNQQFQKLGMGEDEQIKFEKNKNNSYMNEENSGLVKKKKKKVSKLRKTIVF